MITPWPVAVEHEVAEHDLAPGGTLDESALRGWVAQAWRAYVDQCPSLGALEMEGGNSLAVREIRWSRVIEAEPGSSLLLGLSVTELRPLAVEAAIRIRLMGDEPGVVDGRMTVVVTNGSGQLVEMPEAVRADVARAQANARQYV